MSEPRKVKVLTRLKITEVSAVDRGAGEGCRVVLSKRDDSDYSNTELSVEERARAEMIGRMALRDQEEMEKREYERIHGTGHNDHEPADDEGENPFLAIFKRPREAEKSFAADARGDEADRDDEQVPASELDGHVISPAKKHRPVTFDTTDGTRMRFPNERSLAEWTAIQQRIRKSPSPEDSTPMPINLSDIVKNHGVIALAKYMVEQNSSFGTSEAELVELATQDAARRYPGSTPAMAFAKLYEESAELRGAIEVAKSAAFEDAVTVELERDSREAMAELTKIGNERWPSLSPSQRFARAFECSPDLAKRAHRRPGPSTSFAHPVAKSPLVNVDSVTLTPQYVTETNVDDPEKALAQLKALGRQKWPSLSEAQSFLNAVTDPENAPLVRAALHRPTGSTPPRQSY